jgi:hypothetical protein
MSATPHDLSAIDAMGAQFKNNIFDKVPGKFASVHKAAVATAKNNAAQAASSRNAWASSAASMTAQGRQNFARGQAAQQVNAVKAQKAQAAAVKTGRAAPSPSAAPRTFAMPAGPQGVQQRTQQATMASQVNNAHSDALREAGDRHKTMTQQKNFAHGDALKEAGKRAKEAQKGAAPTPTKRTASAPVNSGGLTGPAPAAFNAPSGGSKVPSSSQFANIVAKDNKPFPTHQHPEGSSHLKLQGLTDSQPRPNEFTVGSRAAKPGGIAARGSQLEAWAISKSSAVQARQASRRAGGRDKTLSSAAKVAENFANQPMKKFAP